MPIDETVVRNEIMELEKKKQEMKQKISEAKKGRNFLQKTGISIGAGSRMAALKKDINERKEILKLLSQKKKLGMQKEVIELKAEVFSEKEKLRKIQEQKRKQINNDIFNIDDIFKI